MDTRMNRNRIGKIVYLNFALAQWHARCPHILAPYEQLGLAINTRGTTAVVSRDFDNLCPQAFRKHCRELATFVVLKRWQYLGCFRRMP
eukprot:4126260-Prorocentrum_lima.AAC.1